MAKNLEKVFFLRLILQNQGQQGQQLEMSLVFMSKLIMLNLLMKIMNPKMNWLSFQKNSKVVQKTR
ncbi:MAG: Uncharacterised protein [Crocinitomicaceae bacterium]|nr:MAG: Uncharacterised protein [Crocinitomicaceae bacterium]